MEGGICRDLLLNEGVFLCEGGLSLGQEERNNQENGRTECSSLRQSMCGVVFVCVRLGSAPVLIVCPPKPLQLNGPLLIGN